ncbi:MAG: branched-chain amino acid ABC transporter permease [Dehalococcoidia bacterium]|nr:branched-chain amino acid ABC transporter permease [Dehalococcoidia bacterium]
MEFSKFKSKIPLILLITFVVIVVAFPLVIKDRFVLSILIEAGVMCLFALGFAAVFRSGQLSLGQAAFMAIGGYVAALVATKAGSPFWLSLLIGGVASAIVAFLIGIVVLRMGGLYFAIATLAFGEIITIIAKNWDTVTSGMTGIAISAPVVNIGSVVINFAITKLPYYYIIVFLVILFALMFWRIDRSRLGTIVRSTAVAPLLSEHLGMYLMKYRVIMFTLAAFVTGIAGAFYVYYLSWVGPPIFASGQSTIVLIMCVIGGLWSPIAGPLIGAFIVSYFGTIMQIHLEGLRPLVFGVVVILLIFVLPNGLVELQYKFPLWIKSIFKNKSAVTKQ